MSPPESDRCDGAESGEKIGQLGKTKIADAGLGEHPESFWDSFRRLAEKLLCTVTVLSFTRGVVGELPMTTG